jgi:hypothetical protein
VVNEGYNFELPERREAQEFGCESLIHQMKARYSGEILGDSLAALFIDLNVFTDHACYTMSCLLEP